MHMLVREIQRFGCIMGWWIRLGGCGRIWMLGIERARFMGLVLLSMVSGSSNRGVIFANCLWSVPPSPNVTLDTLVDFGILAPKQKISSLLSTIDGPFCYAYI